MAETALLQSPRTVEKIHTDSFPHQIPSSYAAQCINTAQLNPAKELLFHNFLKAFQRLNVSRIRFTAGESLEWSKMNYTQRSKALEKVIRATIQQHLRFNKLIYDLSIIPDAMSIAEARTMGGRKRRMGQNVLKSGKAVQYSKRNQGQPGRIMKIF